jgi:phosphoglycolate phosphatase
VNLLFDLDGTLTDSAPGITRCLQHALVKMGREAPPAEGLRGLIGGDLRQVLARFLATEDKALIESATAHYRERFSTVGLYENELYPDVPQTLAGLKEAGHRLWVVTSKPETFARRIVEHFGLTPFFRAVYGAELSGRNADKTDLLAHVLGREDLEPAATWMIGDRATDIAAGRSNGTRTAGVLWGYGSEKELSEAAPDCLADSMPALAACIQGDQTEKR